MPYYDNAHNQSFHAPDRPKGLIIGVTGHARPGSDPRRRPFRAPDREIPRTVRRGGFAVERYATTS